MRARRQFVIAIFAAAASCSIPRAQTPQASPEPVSLHLQLTNERAPHRPIHAVVWLDPVGDTPLPAPLPARRYTLLQKNRMFTPHLLVVPVGTAVDFPNADPFFHNVFSLFDGKRFDLGLYEAGSSKTVTFSREGVSYIFCNIHPEMSAVVVALQTPLYAIADAHGSVAFSGVAPGIYRLHFWGEGVPQADLNRMTRTLQLTRSLSLGTVSISNAAPAEHLNKFGKPYAKDGASPY